MPTFGILLCTFFIGTSCISLDGADNKKPTPLAHTKGCCCKDKCRCGEKALQATGNILTHNPITAALLKREIVRSGVHAFSEKIRKNENAWHSKNTNHSTETLCCAKITYVKIIFELSLTASHDPLACMILDCLVEPLERKGQLDTYTSYKIRRSFDDIEYIYCSTKITDYNMIAAVKRSISSEKISAFITQCRNTTKYAQNTDQNS